MLNFLDTIGAVFLLFVLGCLWGGAAHAQAPQLINYQGRLLNGTNLVNENVGLSLRLFRSQTGGTPLYEDSNSVIVVDGLYSTYIGDNPTNAAFVAALTNAEVWVETSVNGQTLTPRERLASVGYSLATRGLLVTTNGSVILNLNDNTIGDASTNSAIGGGSLNSIGTQAVFSTISGGFNNAIAHRARYSTIGGGSANEIALEADRATIGGGRTNNIAVGAVDSTISGGGYNQIGAYGYAASIGGGIFNKIEANTSRATIGGGYENVIGASAYAATIGGGRYNKTQAGTFYATIGGGYDNGVGSNAYASAISGGHGNRNNSSYSTIGGGYTNSVKADAPYSTIGGGRSNMIGSNAPNSTISGGYSNENNSSSATIGGGFENNISSNASFAVIGGGRGNRVGTANNTVIGGGAGNSIADWAVGSTIGGGQYNDVGDISSWTTIGGGYQNSIGTNSHYSTINGGNNNDISSSSPYSTIAGGNNNRIGVNATNAFAAGRSAAANHAGAFVWGDNHGGLIASTNENSVTFRAYGGFRMYTAVGVGAHLPPGSGSWTVMSDANAKENYRAVDGAQILDRIAALPVREWNYKTQADAIRHMGPTAQDFRAAFGLGESDTGISTVDADGVALAAIQALVKQNAQLQKNIEELRARLDAVENR